MDEMENAGYTPPWVDMTIIGVAGSSGSGKTSLAIEIVRSLDLPWVIILSIDSFYKSLTPEQNQLAHLNEYDLDSPEAVDFDLLVEKLGELKQGFDKKFVNNISKTIPYNVMRHAGLAIRLGLPNYPLISTRKRVDMPVYSFEQHQRIEKTISLYSPHVVILEGILALNDPRVLNLLDVKVFVEADADLCLSRRIVRDVAERGRTIDGVIKQWFSTVKPVYLKYVEPQRQAADLIVPRGMQNRMAINMIVGQIRQALKEKSIRHRAELERLGKQVEDQPLSPNVHLLEFKPQIRGVATILTDTITEKEEFSFYLDRLAALLVEKALDFRHFVTASIQTPTNQAYNGLTTTGKISAVVVLRGGSCLEAGLRRTIPDCRTGRLLIQSNLRTGEPELHYLILPPDIADHDTVLILDSQMSSGGAALMAVKVLVDHGVAEDKIVFVAFMAGRRGLNRLMKVFPGIHSVTGSIIDDHEKRWIEERYFGC